MSNDISYEEAGTSTKFDILVQYCKQGALAHKKADGVTLRAWEDGLHLVNVYLDHNKAADKATLKAVASELDEWLIGNRPMNLTEARTKLQEAESLDELLSVLRQAQNDLNDQDLANLDITYLPTFGSKAPSDTHGIWSWDAENLLIGEGFAELKLVPRDREDE